ncbi:MAG TPA: hypothetical protein DCQ06_01995, partial [Myxococcales bacterium]|nr:hypothetical protein [Myxococcales bacterium]
QQRTFREDLYYRLAVFTLNLPPLTERKDDIEPLLLHFLKQACADEGRTTLPQVSNEVLWVMHHHSWPGNVRQLQNVVKHAVVVGDSSLVKIGDLPSSFTRQLDRDDADSATSEDPVAPSAQIEGNASNRLDQVLEMAFPDTSVLPSADDLQSAGTRLVMKRLKNNRKRTAQVLGVSRATLYRRIAADPSLTE